MERYFQEGEVVDSLQGISIPLEAFVFGEVIDTP
jgi:hypothetical protein